MSDDDQAFWGRMRTYTQARIGLGRSGSARPTAAALSFQLGFARARDAVYASLDTQLMESRLAGFETITVASRALDRPQYLKRPDLGRLLSPASMGPLEAARGAGSWDVAFVIADGLSAQAAHHWAPEVLRQCVSALKGFTIAPIVLASQARVGLSDDIAVALNATAVLIMLGERPGLSVPDSLGVYFTYAPRKGTADSERNCISNVHANGLATAVAGDRAAWLIREASRLRFSGVDLKENAPAMTCPRLSGAV